MGNWMIPSADIVQPIAVEKENVNIFILHVEISLNIKIETAQQNDVW